jgi:hypothetical protein
VKTSLRTIIGLLPLVILASSSLAFAQNRERFGISAKAGGVNVVVGHVMVARKDQDPQLLSSKDNLTAGEVVTTGSTGNAEILLNPGSYLRLAENSEFKFEDISLDHLQLRLAKGSAIIEATGVADMDLGIKISTPHANFSIMRSGIYRINVQPDSSELAVRKGRGSFGPNKTDIVKGGNTITIGRGFSAQGKLPKEKDAFEVWSKQRAEFLAKANEKLSQRTLNGYLSSFNGWDSWFWGPRRFGLWTFNASFGCYTFLPFYYGWSSPYGHWYGSYYWRGNPSGGAFGNPNPIIVNNQTPPPGSGSTPTGGTPPSGTGPGPSPTGFGNPGPGSSNAAPRDPDSGGRAINRPRDP